MRTSCRASATRATACSVRRTDTQAPAGWLGSVPALKRPRFRRHPAVPATHRRRLRSFSLRFRCIRGRFRAAAPLPHRRGVIKFESARRAARPARSLAPPSAISTGAPRLRIRSCGAWPRKLPRSHRAAALRPRLGRGSCMNRLERLPAGSVERRAGTARLGSAAGVAAPTGEHEQRARAAGSLSPDGLGSGHDTRGATREAPDIATTIALCVRPAGARDGEKYGGSFEMGQHQA
ncbi:conserved hypothetical protein [Paraburkholderia atlantica]|uniref:Uncharacterized protein n=1 Tax=Paraburkholderia atlantica TaxID=2654982 RepID=D5W5G5_PARAM|nr:conserved hypothetical protein [Paraburkholderia atlantica]